MPKRKTISTVCKDPGVKRRIKLGRELVRKNVELMRRECCNFEEMDYDDVRIERRIQTVAMAFDETRQYLREVCPEYPDLKEEDWMYSGIIARDGYDILDEGKVFTLACAVWMLDQLRQCGRLEEARQLLPRDERIYDGTELPEIRDAFHDEVTIRGMLWVICHRNDDCTGVYRNRKEKLRRCVLDRYTAGKKQHQQVPSRQRFESILAMIPRSKIDEAVRYFEEAYHDVLCRTHISTCRYFNMHMEIQNKYDRL